MTDPLAMPATAAASPGDVTPRHFAFVDALRGWAILAVILFHADQIIPGSFPLVHRIASYGGNGVQLFFVISSFTLFWSMRNRRSVDRRPVLAFFVRRFFRVAPLFWIGIAFYLAHPDYFRDQFAPDGIGWPQILSTFFFVHGWYPTTANSVVPGGWSIAAEMMSYLTLPLLFRWVRTFNVALALATGSSLLVAAGTPIAIRILAPHFPPQWFGLVTIWVSVSFPAQFPCFCWGIVLYFLLADPKPLNMQRIAAILICGIALAFGPVYLRFAAAFVLLAWALAVRPLGLIVNQFTRYIGLISYSAYLWHFCLLDGFAPWLFTVIHISSQQPFAAGTLRLLILYTGLVAITMIVASASYFLIEQPFINLGRWVIFQRFALHSPPRRGS